MAPDLLKHFERLPTPVPHNLQLRLDDELVQAQANAETLGLVPMPRYDSVAPWVDPLCLWLEKAPRRKQNATASHRGEERNKNQYS
jgi:hypothetical protein